METDRGCEDDAASHLGIAHPLNSAVTQGLDAWDTLHYFWHKAWDAFHEPARFRHELQALIQAARNVTFHIQSRKSATVDFDSWYDEWQHFMRNDPLMAWVNEARREVVHVGNLSSRSRAHVTLFNSYTDHVRYEFDFDPTLTTEQLVGTAIEAARTSRLSAAQLDRTIVEIRRSWATTGMPGDDVMDVIAYAARVYLAMIADLAGRGRGSHAASLRDVVDGMTAPACMMFFSERRVMRLNPSTQVTYGLGRDPIDLDPEQANDRYSLDEKAGPTIRAMDREPGEGDVSLMARTFIPIARAVLENDGYHVPIAWLRNRTGSWQINTLKMEDEEEKLIMAHTLAEMIREKESDALVFIGEAWIDLVVQAGLVPAEGYEKTSRRTDCVHICALSADEDPRAWVIPFEVETGKPVLKPTVEVDAQESIRGFLEPAYKALRRI